MDWEEFEEKVASSECAAVYPGSNLVIGRGSKNPRIVFVGEAPGAEEDRLQKPFVGRSGKLLDEWIAWLGLDEDDYYICNVMKTRPPENRDPTKEEIALCSPLLKQQLDLLGPDVIIAVGRFAMNYFFPKYKSILKESGRIVNGKFFIVPHPSYFLRRGGTGWEEYLEGLRAFLSGEGPKESQTTLFSP